MVLHRDHVLGLDRQYVQLLVAYAGLPGPAVELPQPFSGAGKLDELELVATGRDMNRQRCASRRHYSDPRCKRHLGDGGRGAEERSRDTQHNLNYLGVVSLVRRDFEQLVTLMKEWKEVGDTTEARKPIDRIVLYIDDLDRCKPDQVVTVLQAVHLLLAMDLFVVVVGVDPRWLLRSLRRRYRRDLGAGAVVAGDRESGFSESTPQNYLEKIFQVPFVLPGMDEIGFSQLMSHLAAPAAHPARQGSTDGSVTAAVGPADATPDRPDSPARPTPSPAAQPAEPQSEVAAVVHNARRVTVTPMTKDELALLSSLAPLVGTPRAATRLFNIYGLLRSTRNLTEGSRFLGTRDRPGDYQAVLQLLGVLTSAPQLLGTLLWGRSLDGIENRGLMHADPTAAGRVSSTDWNPWAGDRPGATASPRTCRPTKRSYGAACSGTLRDVHNHVKADDIERYQLWGPRVARFSFVLSPFATEPSVPTTVSNS